MQHIDITSLTFINRRVNSAIYTSQAFLNEIIIFALGERLIMGPTSIYSLHVEMHDYILSILDPLDVPLITTIIDEMEKIINSISSELVYSSFYLSGECFLKYEYDLHSRFSRLHVYQDTYDFKDPLYL